MALFYDEPTLQGFEIWNQDGATRKRTLLDDCYARKNVEEGAFVMCAKEAVVGCYAVAGIVSHMGVLNEFSDTGRPLGGGRIEVDLAGKRIFLSGYSQTFGSLPNTLLEHYFTSFGYHVKANMSPNGKENWWLSEFASNYFKEHGLLDYLPVLRDENQ